MYYSDEIIEEVRNSTDIVGYISSHINLKKQGGNYVGLCPFHNEKTPSFSVSPKRQMYYCFGCGVGGSVFTFAMEYDNLTFPEAVNMLAKRSGINLPEVEESEETKRNNSIRARLLDINREAGVYYYSILKSENGRIGYDYFKKRGLSDDIIKKFALGYTGKSGGLYRFLKNKGYTDDELKMSGLFSFDEKQGPRDKFWNRVMFPIMDANNKVIAFGGRVMGDALPKYLNSPETQVFDKSRNLYGLNYARYARKPYFILCEGYMDVIALHQAGFSSACASLGTAFTGMQANLIKRYVNQVIISYDSDGAGVKAALRAIPILKNAGISVKVLDMMPYKDPDEFIKNLGSEEYEKRIEKAINSFFFEIKVLEREYDFSDPEQKTHFFNEMAKKLLVFEDELERNNYIESMAVKYAIRTEDLKKLVAKMSANIAGIPVNVVKTKREAGAKEDGNSQAQSMLLTWMTNEPVLFEKLKGILEPDDFFNEPYHKIAVLLYEQFESGGDIIPAKILNSFENAEEQSMAAGVLHKQLPELAYENGEKQKVLNELVKRIKKNSITRMTRTVTEPAELQKLMIMMTNLQKLHISL
ncbi:MAG: DNA primase [Lachnospiraceae bacterium]|nr:DNA primase [Lachnospiraceae bacterium]